MWVNSPRVLRNFIKIASRHFGPNNSIFSNSFFKPVIPKLLFPSQWFPNAAHLQIFHRPSVCRGTQFGKHFFKLMPPAFSTSFLVCALLLNALIYNALGAWDVSKIIALYTFDFEGWTFRSRSPSHWSPVLLRLSNRDWEHSFGNVFIANQYLRERPWGTVSCCCSLKPQSTIRNCMFSSVVQLLWWRRCCVHGNKHFTKFLSTMRVVTKIIYSRSNALCNTGTF